MGSFINIFFPTVRRTVPSVGNPAYADDIKAANELLIDGLSALLGLYNSNGFLIISGMLYDQNTHTYAPGIYWLNGSFYYQQVAFPEGSYLKGSQQPVMPKPFSDTNLRPIYVNYISTAVSDPAGATPIFQGDMAAVRVGLYENKVITLALQDVASHLKSAAFADIGNLPGTVAAGNDPRLVGTLAFFDGRYAQKVDVILKNLAVNPGAYTPQNDWDPVNKLYVDTATKVCLASGSINVGDADSAGGTLKTIALGTVLPANYLITFSCGSLSANHNLDIFFNVMWCNKTTVSFGLWFKEAQAGVQNIQVDYLIWKL